MMTAAQIETATLDQLTDELGAAGAYSQYTDIDEARKAVRSIIAQNQSFSVQWEFMGPATQEHFDAAQAVADAMEILGTIETTKDVLAKACQILGRDWDANSVLAMIEHCSFERVDQETAIEITRQALDAGKIVHTGWTPSRDTADQCGVNVVDYFDGSGNYLGPDENGLAPTFERIDQEASADA